MLSTLTLIDFFKSILRVSSNCVTNFTSLTVSHRATYSASVLDNVMFGCALDFQEIGTTQAKLMYPVILFRSSLPPAKLLSLNATMFQDFPYSAAILSPLDLFRDKKLINYFNSFSCPGAAPSITFESSLTGFPRSGLDNFTRYNRISMVDLKHL